MTFQVPRISVEITPETGGDISKALFTMTNQGYGPATNVSFTIYSTQKIVGIFNNFSTTEIIYPVNKSLEINTEEPVNFNQVELRIPTLIPLDGSKVNLITTIDLKDYDRHQNNYYASAVYDQGSSESKTPNQLGLVEESNIYLTLFYFTFYISIAIFFLFYIIKWRRHSVFKNIISNAIILRDTLNDPKSKESFYEFDMSLTRQVSNLPHIMKNKTTNKLYFALRERQKNLGSNNLEMYNNKLKEVVDDIWIMDKIGAFD